MMIKTFAAAVMASALIAGGLVKAQANDKCAMCAFKMDAGKKTDKLALILDLNDKQKSQVKDLVDAKIKKLEPAMDQMKKQRDQASEEFSVSIKKVLSSAQAKKFDTWKDMEKPGCGH
jgi:outer membrane murein-binding lipoprotein Lpp